MAPHLLILGGTTEASILAKQIAERGISAIFSYAGRTDRPKPQPLSTRIGGFGGADGLARYLRDEKITHVIDATHPFAAQMSWNAFHACKSLNVPLLAFTRPAWRAKEGDQWHHVPDIDAAVEALKGPPKRVMLALGRMHVDAFAIQPQHHYVLRFVDHPKSAPALPRHSLIVARGPFDLEGDIALFKAHDIALLICKNAGGLGAQAKLYAARALRIPVLMIDRPVLPERPEVADKDAVLHWISQKGDMQGGGHAETDRGV